MKEDQFMAILGRSLAKYIDTMKKLSFFKKILCTINQQFCQEIIILYELGKE